jgi:hypothetical protein
MCEFRKLKANELQIKCTDTKFKGSATLLIYKDARVDQKVLDETVTPMRWQKDYKEIDGKIYCGVGIKNAENGEWIWKWDCGTEGNFEAEKSEASDAFKRACFNWGLGRELYDTPKIKIKCPDNYYYNDKLSMTFSVKSIEWNDNELADLVIVDKFNKVVYDYKNLGVKTTVPNLETEEQKFFKIDNKELLIQFCRNTKATLKTEAEVSTLEKFYKYYSPKMAEWKGNLNLDSLYKGWCERERK